MKKSTVGTIVKFTFDNLEPLEFDTATLSDANKAHCIPFAMEHRLGDMAAIAKSKDNNYTVTEDMRRVKVAAGIAHYTKSDATWNMRGDGAPTLNPHVAELAQKRNCTYAEAMAYIAQKALAELA